jgi:SnoaL-like protein
MTDATKGWGGPASEPSIDELRQQHAIGQLAKTYALGMDLRDYDLARSAFADEAMGEERGTMLPVDQYLKNTYAMGASFHATQHLIAQQYIRIDGDEAEAWSYGVAHHKVAPGEARDEIIAGVQYRDRCRRFERGWLITERRVHLLWMDMAPARAPSPRPG